MSLNHKNDFLLIHLLRTFGLRMRVDLWQWEPSTLLSTSKWLSWCFSASLCAKRKRIGAGIGPRRRPISALLPTRGAALGRSGNSCHSVSSSVNKGRVTLPCKAMVKNKSEIACKGLIVTHGTRKSSTNVDISSIIGIHIIEIYPSVQDPDQEIHFTKHSPKTYINSWFSDGSLTWRGS